MPDNSRFPAPNTEPFNPDHSEIIEAWEGRGLTAIPTTYNGFRCRSRLEARWLLFLDELGIAYNYEPEGFRLPNGLCYLPDLWFPQIHFWGEVKPGTLTTEETAKACGLAASSGHPVLLLIGPPDFIPYETIDKDACRYSYSLDIHFYRLRYYLQENRLYAMPTPEELFRENCSLQYACAVDVSRAARFDRGNS
jgi:hypothetical protein